MKDNMSSLRDRSNPSFFFFTSNSAYARGKLRDRKKIILKIMENTEAKHFFEISFSQLLTINSFITVQSSHFYSFTLLRLCFCWKMSELASKTARECEQKLPCEEEERGHPWLFTILRRGLLFEH